MTDYVITKVRFNPATTHLVEVLVNDEGASLTRIEQRSKVVEKIAARRTYRTQPPGGGAGAAVQIVDVNGEKFLRTDANKTAKDNLENLPTF